MDEKIIAVPKILLPKENVDMTKWAVIACDQFTSQGDYWQKLADTCGDTSALHIIFPEYYLDKCDRMAKVDEINSKMEEYLDAGIFREEEGFILTRRRTCYGNIRTGLILAIRLDDYDYTTGRLAIKATEATVPERLPIRIQIREKASLELPHVLLLIDDEERSVIEPLYEKRKDLKKLYDFDLNMNGGHIEGYLVDDAAEVKNKLLALANKDRMKARYGKDESFLFAVGDGNHSVATAKNIWEKIKPTLTEEERLTHPAGYMLVEVVNLYEDDLKFEAIHRGVFGVNQDFVDGLKANVKGDSKVKVLYRGEETVISVPSVAAEAVDSIQKYIDAYIKSHEGASVDYIHGDGNLVKVCEEKDGVAIFMPIMRKQDLFNYVTNVGSLPRKTFSMGEAEEKRYYLEARKITK